MKSEYTFSCDKTDMDIEAIHAFLSGAYWSKGIPRETLQTAIDNSICFGIFLSGSQVGFARAITDRATFAYLADVYVLEEHRGNGLGKLLVQQVATHPQLQGLRRAMLATRDAHSLYAGFGFTALADPGIMMENLDPGVYTRI